MSATARKSFRRGGESERKKNWREHLNKGGKIKKMAGTSKKQFPPEKIC
jgi:hypothetical protein